MTTFSVFSARYISCYIINSVFHTGQNQFLGWIQEMSFYGETLSNRDIDLLYSGTLPELHIDTECRCPPSHPRVKPTETTYCIPNGVTDNTGQQILRLNEYAHPLGYLNDGNAMSFFVSRFLDDLTLMIDFGNEFSVSWYTCCHFLSCCVGSCSYPLLLPVNEWLKFCGWQFQMNIQWNLSITTT